MVNDIAITQSGEMLLHQCTVVDELGQSRDIAVTTERALTIYLNKREIVTLMTMGSHPEWLVLGYLLNQQLIQDVASVRAIQVDWEVSAAVVSVKDNDKDTTQLTEQLSKRTVTSGCGQGTMFGDAMATLEPVAASATVYTPALVYQLLTALQEYNQVYKTAGAVHACALCTEQGEISFFVEDVGRHNAVDAISGWMALHDVSGKNKIFYTTGRLTSEMVIKVAQMQIPIVLSRSGVTEMGLDIAKKMGITLVARTKGKHFLIFHQAERFQFSSCNSSQ